MDTETSRFLRKRLKELRAKTRMTQEQLAELAGINYKYYQEIEIGRSSELRVSTLEKIAKVFGWKPHQLLNPEMPPIKISKIHLKFIGPKKRGRKPSKKPKS